MELKDVVSVAGPAITALVVITGWFISKSLDRKHEIFKRQLAKREEIAQALAEHCYRLFAGKGNEAEWQRLSLLVQIYGKEDEIRALNELGGAQDENQATQVARLKEFQRILVGNVRRDLGYS